jgi:leucyl/phenylalanyl-tRNA--protein transferase
MSGADDTEDENDDGSVLLTPELLLGAYAAGIFPMAEGRHADGIGWYDPERRGILPLDALHIPARLRRSVRARLYDVTFNRDFAAVIRSCADARAETWINDDIIALYTETHRRGFAHSVEVRERGGGTIVGGLYGIALGGAFFGESMFSTARDASKVGFVHLAARLRARGFALWDAQFTNPHLLQFGCVEIPRAEYHRRLRDALLMTDIRFMRRRGAYSSGEASVSSASAAASSAAGSVAMGAAADGSASDEYVSDFAEVTDFLQSITQTS